MEQQNSIKSELNTLIMLEQQQTDALQALNSKGGFMPTPVQVGGFGHSYYNPNMGGFQSVPGYRGVRGAGYPGMSVATNYLNEMAAATGWNQHFGSHRIQNAQDSIRNAMLNADMEKISPFWANQSKLNAEMAEQLGTNLGAKMATGTLSAASMLSGFGFGSTLLGGVAGVAVGGAINIANDQLKQNYAYDRYLQQNSYRFINMTESNNTRAPGGFNRNERWQAADWLRHFGTEMKISDDDTMMLLKNYTEGDLLRQVQDIDTFKEQMTKMTKAVKTMALSLNETLEETAKVMGELKAKGIDSRNYEHIAAESKIVGSMTGQSASEVLQFTSDLSQNLVAGTGMDIDKVQSGVSKTQAYVGKIFSDAEIGVQAGDKDAEATWNYISNSGGVNGATQRLMQSISNDLESNDYTQRFLAAAMDEQGNIDKDKLREYSAQLQSGQIDLNTLAQENVDMWSRKSSLGELANWLSYGTEKAKELLLSDPSAMADWYLGIAKSAGRTTNMAPDDAMLNALNMNINKDDARFLYNMLQGVGGLGSEYGEMVDRAAFAQQMIDQSNSKRAGFGYTLKNFWAGAKDFMGDVVSPVTGLMNVVGEKASDWWYGRDYGDVRSMIAGVTDWNPYDDFNQSLSQLSQFYYDQGQLDKAKQFDPARSKEYTGDLRSERELYSTIDKLSAALGKLAETVDVDAGRMREIAQEYNLSETTLVHAINASGATQEDEVIQIANEMSELLIANSGNQYSAFHDYLEKHRLTSYDMSTGGITYENGAAVDNFKYDNVLVYSPGRAEEASRRSAKEIVDHVLSDIPQIELDENIMDIVKFNQETREMFDDPSRWSQLSWQERYKRTAYAEKSLAWMQENGFDENSPAVQMTRGIGSSEGVIVSEFSGDSDKFGEYLDRVYVSHIDENGNKVLALAKTKEDAEGITANNTQPIAGVDQKDRFTATTEEKLIFLRGELGNEEGVEYADAPKIGAKVVELEQELKKWSDELEAARREEADSWVSLQGLGLSDEAMQGIEDGSISSEQDLYDFMGASFEASETGQQASKHIRSYVDAKTKQAEASDHVGELNDSILHGKKIMNEASSREAGYIMLAKNLGWEHDLFGSVSDESMEQKDIQSIEIAMRKTANGSVGTDIEEGVVKAIGEDLLNGAIGLTVGEDDEQIISAMTRNLMKGGGSEDMARSFAESYVNSLDAGKTLDENSQQQAVQHMMEKMLGGTKDIKNDGNYRIDVIGHLETIDKNLATLTHKATEDWNNGKGGNATAWTTQTNIHPGSSGYNEGKSGNGADNAKSSADYSAGGNSTVS